jgi:DNA-binding LacI/PurR family transcriptional regulator
VSERSVADPPSSSVPTINDVAALAEVSRQTVSNVLNAPERVKPETRARVEAAIAELGYYPDRSAQNLRARATKLLGYRIAESPAGAINTVLDRFLHALTEAARDRRYQILLFTSSDGDEELAAYDDLIRTKAVDGFVLSETNYGDPRIGRLRDRGIPFAVFGRTEVDDGHGWVDVDNAAGTRRAVEHLVETGRRRIAFLGWPAGSVTGDERARGYREALQAAGLAVDPTLDARGLDAVATGHRAADLWLDRDDPPDAVVAASDLLAIGVLHAIWARGLTAGADLAVTGFDDTPTAAFLSTPLTSVRQPIEETAAHVVRRLIAQITGAAVEPGGQLVLPTLIVRDSTGPPGLR